MLSPLDHFPATTGYTGWDQSWDRFSAPVSTPLSSIFTTRKRTRDKTQTILVRQRKTRR